MRRKPAGLEPSYAAQFDDASVVAAYPTRPPYSNESLAFLADLAGGSSGRILDLGCGTGELARRMASKVNAITAIDRSERMMARARELPGGGARNVEWIEGQAEDFPESGPFSLILAAESFHWFDWDVLCPRLVRLVNAPLVLVERREAASPWADRLQRLIPAFSTNREYEPYELVTELTARGFYSVRGRRSFGPEPFRQSIDDYITSIHSRNGFSRDRMSAHAAVHFDDAVRALVAAHAIDGALTLRIATDVTWGVVCSAR